MWLSNAYPEQYQDLWSSSDGVTWDKVVDPTPYDLYSNLIVFDGKLWAVDGSVWSSVDGITWDEVATSTPLYWPKLAAHDGKIWAFGNGPSVWSSPDGVNWTCVNTNAPYGDRSSPAVTVFDGKLWLIGGSTPAPGKGVTNPDGLGYPDIDMNNDVWSSVDGVTWTLVTNHAPWRGRMWFSAEAYAGRLWVLGGYDNDAYENLGDTWYTTDGVNWEQVIQSEPSWSPRHYPTTWVHNNDLWIGAGNSWPFNNDVWKLHAATATNTLLTVSANPANYGDSITFTATISSPTATGTVTFQEGSTIMATVPVASSAAAYVTSTLPAGSHTITASYSGDGDNVASTGSVTVEILPIGSAPVISKSFAASTLPVNGTTTLNFTLSNPNASLALSGVAFVDQLPEGLTVATPSNLTGSCGSGTIEVSPDLTTITLSGGALAAAGNCTFGLDLIGITAGTKTNVTGAVTSAEGGTGNSATATVDVLAPPLLSKAFGAATIPLNGSTSLTFTISNPAPNALELSGIAFTDTLPSNLTVATPNGQTGSCGSGVITATEGGSSVTLSGATLAAGQSCTFGVDVLGIAAGTANNTTSTVTSSNGGSGNNANASLEVIGPDLAITKSHSGDFIHGETGRTYTIVASNVGLTATSDVVTVVDTLPTGLTATAIGGSGWDCTLATLTCTRSDALPASDSYPPLTLTVNVSPSAPSSITNSVHVSGGGEINVANNEATDPTKVLQPPDLIVAKTHSGNFAQAQMGRAYTITVTNIGETPTIGTVSVNDLVPAGLTPVSFGGVGWACDVGTVSCTRNDPLAANSSYPVITLTVNVSNNAPPAVTNFVTVSGGGESNTTNDSASDPTTILIAPTNLTATAISTSQVSLTWDSVVGATNYQVFRSSDNSGFSLVGFPFTNSFLDTGLAPSKTYIYFVVATDPTNIGLPSNVDLATTVLFTDDPVVPAMTAIKAVHITQLRTAVDLVRAAAGLPTATYADTITGGTVIRAQHVAELRSALNDARLALGLTALTFTDPILEGTPIKAVHIRELRSGLR